MTLRPRKRIPTALRALAWRSSSFRYFGKIHHHIYWKAAALAARRFLSCRGVEQVDLVRGMVRGPLPGISDVDFVIQYRVPSGMSEAAMLLPLRKHYRELRRVFPMLGDLVLHSPEQGGLGINSVHFGDSSLRFDGNGWVQFPRYRSKYYCISEHLSTGLILYLNALAMLSSKHCSSPFLQAQLKRFLIKTISLIEGNKVAPIEGTLAELFFRAYQSLEVMAGRALESLPFSASPQMAIEWETPSRESYVLSQLLAKDFSDFGGEGREAVATSVPFYFTLRHASVDFFDCYIQYLAQENAFSRWAAYFLPPNGYRGLLATFPSVLPSSYWEYFLHCPVAEERQVARASAERGMRDWIKLYLPNLKGNAVTGGMAYFHSTVLPLNEVALMIENRVITLNGLTSTQSALAQNLTRLKKEVSASPVVDEYQFVQALCATDQVLVDWFQSKVA